MAKSFFNFTKQAIPEIVWWSLKIVKKKLLINVNWQAISATAKIFKTFFILSGGTIRVTPVKKVKRVRIFSKIAKFH